MLCCAAQRCAVLCFVCCAVLYGASLYGLMPRHVVLCYANLCGPLPCFAVLLYANPHMRSYAKLCYAGQWWGLRMVWVCVPSNTALDAFGCATLGWAVLGWAVLCCAVLRCAVVHSISQGAVVHLCQRVIFPVLALLLPFLLASHFYLAFLLPCWSAQHQLDAILFVSSATIFVYFPMNSICTSSGC